MDNHTNIRVITFRLQNIKKFRDFKQNWYFYIIFLYLCNIEHKIILVYIFNYMYMEKVIINEYIL